MSDVEPEEMPEPFPTTPADIREKIARLFGRNASPTPAAQLKLGWQSQAYTSALLGLAVEALAAKVETSAAGLESSTARLTTALTTEIAAFTKASEEGAKALSRATWGLFIATCVLVLVTIPMAVEAIQKILSHRP